MGVILLMLGHLADRRVSGRHRRPQGVGRAATPFSRFLLRRCVFMVRATLGAVSAKFRIVAGESAIIV